MPARQLAIYNEPSESRGRRQSRAVRKSAPASFGTSRSPRRSCASSRSRSRMARLASLTATYMLQPPFSDKPRGARIATTASSSTSTTSTPRGNSSALTASRFEQVDRLKGRCSRPCVDPGRAIRSAVLCQACHLQISVGRTVQVFIAAEGEAIERRQRAGRVTDQRKMADRGSAMTGAPVWNLSHFATSVSDIAGSSQTAYRIEQRQRSPRARMTTTATAERPRCANAAWRAIASIIGRKVDCADRTLSAKQRAVRNCRHRSTFPAQRVEIDPRRRSLPRLAAALGDHRRPQRRQHFGFHASENRSDCTSAST